MNVYEILYDRVTYIVTSDAPHNALGLLSDHLGRPLTYYPAVRDMGTYVVILG